MSLEVIKLFFEEGYFKYKEKYYNIKDQIQNHLTVHPDKLFY